MAVAKPVRHIVAFALFTLFISGCAYWPSNNNTQPQPTPPRVVKVEVIPAAKPNPMALAAIKKLDNRINQMRSLKIDTNDVRQLQEEATIANRNKDYNRAEGLANRGAQIAAQQINRHYSLKTIALLKNAPKTNLPAAQQKKLDDIEAALRTYQGQKAFQLAKLFQQSAKVRYIVYKVVGGDSLAGISAKERIYGNPYWWPLIYRENADKIKRPEIIYAGQKFNIDLSPSLIDAKQAIRYANERAIWSVRGQKQKIRQKDAEYVQAYKQSKTQPK